MPAGEVFQFGFEHRLYIGADVLNTRPGETPPASPVHYNTPGQWELAREYKYVRDVAVGGSDNTVDITTRDEARRGFTVEPIVTTTGQITFQIRWEAGTTADLSDGDVLFKELMNAWITKKSVPIMELDNTLDTIGAQGTVGNYNIGFTWNKPVQGAVVVDVTARLVSYPDWLVVQSYVDPDATFERIENLITP